MHIKLENISKRFGPHWIFKRFNYSFDSDKSYAITGPNGSGKSTLLKMISGGLVPSAGSISFTDQGREIFWSDAAAHISYAAPYVDIIERLTLREHLDFHFNFRNPIQGITTDSIIELLEMQKDANKFIKDFSSGMRQRVKLALALYTDSKVILLDEPTSNLDTSWTKWYLDLAEQRTKDALVIVASNHESEYPFVDQEVSVISNQ